MSILRALGVVLLVVWVIWIGWTVWSGGGLRLEHRVVQAGPAFEGSVQLPRETIAAEVNACDTKMQALERYSRLSHYTALGTDWGAFLLTALITLLAGFRGQVRTSVASTDAALAEIVKGESSRFAKTVGTLAALAAIATALSAKAKTSSDDFYKDAGTVQTAVMTARKDLQSAKDLPAAQEVLGALHRTCARF